MILQQGIGKKGDMSTYSRCMIAPCAFPCLVEFFLICNGETFRIGCNFAKKLKKICGLTPVHVCVENQLRDLKIDACLKGSPGIFFNRDVSRLWKTAVIVFQVEYFIWLSTMWMVHDFDVVLLKRDGRWSGTIHFIIWKAALMCQSWVRKLDETHQGLHQELSEFALAEVNLLRS